MATVINDRDDVLQAASVRLEKNPNNYIYFSNPAPVFRVAADGVTITPASYAIQAVLAGQLSGTVTWSVVSGTIATTGINGNTWTISGGDLTTDTAVIRASLTFLGPTYTADLTVTKLQQGVSAVVIDLSNENQTVTANFDGSSPVLTNAVTTVSIFEGATDVSAQWTVTATPSTGLTGTLVGKTYTVATLTVDSAYVDFTATRSGYSNQTIRYKISKAKAGIDGTSATVYELEASAGVIKRDASGTAIPASITFSAYSITGSAARTAYTGSIKIQTSTNGTTFTDVSTTAGSSATYTIAAGVIAVRGLLFITDGTGNSLDQETVLVIADGANGAPGAPGAAAVVIDLSNENQTVTANADGSSPVLTNAVTTVSIFEGATDVSAQWTVTATPSTGLTGTLVGKTYTVATLTVDSAYVDFTATRSGYSNQTIRYKISKAKAGIDGTSATVYELEASAGVIKRDASGTAIPASITFSAYSITGSAARTAYTGSIKIQTSTNGTTFTDVSTTAGSSATYTIAAGVIAVRGLLFITDGTGNSLDQETVLVIADGAAGTNTARIGLYNKNTSSSSAPTAFTGTFTYTFSTSALSGGTLNGWTTSAPSITNGEYLWARFAVATSNTDTDTILASEFSAAAVQAVGGTNAITGQLTRDSVILPADEFGNILSFADAGGTFKVLDGTTDKTGNTAQVTYSVLSSTGMTVSIANTGVYALTAAVPPVGKKVVLTTAAQVFNYTTGIVPTNTVVTATASNFPAGVTLFYEFVKGVTSQQNISTTTYTYTPNATYGSMPETITVNVREGASTGTIIATDSIIMQAVRTTSGTARGFLTNASADLAADIEGRVSATELNTATGTFRVFTVTGTEVTGTAVTYSKVSTTNGADGTIDTTGTYRLTRLPTSSPATIAFRAVHSGVTHNQTFTINISKSTQSMTATLRAVYGGVNLDRQFTATRSVKGNRGAVTGYGTQYAIYLSGTDDTTDPWPPNSTNAYRANRVISNTVNNEVLTTNLTTTNHLAIGDFVTLTNAGATQSETRYWSGANWFKPGTVIDGNLLVNGTISANKLFVTELSSVTANTGNLTISTTGSIKGGQTAYNTGTGFFLGYDSTAYKFSIGSSTNGLNWSGSSLSIIGANNNLVIGTSATTGARITINYDADNAIKGYDSAGVLRAEILPSKGHITVQNDMASYLVGILSSTSGGTAISGVSSGAVSGGAGGVGLKGSSTGTGSFAKGIEAVASGVNSTAIEATAFSSGTSAIKAFVDGTGTLTNISTSGQSSVIAVNRAGGLGIQAASAATGTGFSNNVGVEGRSSHYFGAAFYSGVAGVNAATLYLNPVGSLPTIGAIQGALVVQGGKLWFHTGAAWREVAFV